jgi:hypothetical protein
MYDIVAAKRFLTIILTAHRASWRITQKAFSCDRVLSPFTLVSLLKDTGFCPDDWGDMPEMDAIYQYWYDQRLSTGATPVEANTMANLIAASRAGWLLSQVLKKEFVGRFKVEELKDPSRFGGRNQYSWQ